MNSAPNEKSLPSRSSIVRHIEQHVGKIDLVWTELVPLNGHIDIHIVRPTTEKPHFTLVTSGMSDHAMSSLNGSDGKYIELVLCLPPNWTPNNQNLKNEVVFWPIRLLRNLAKSPRVDDRWIWLGHTLPNSAPFEIPAQYAGILISWALNEAEEFETLVISEDMKISFFVVYPIFKEELDYKLQHGSVKLMKLMEEQKIPMTINPNRVRPLKKTWWKLFG